MSAHPSIKAPFEDVGWAVKGSAEEEDEAAAAAMAKALDRAHKLRASSGRASSSEGGHSQGCAKQTLLSSSIDLPDGTRAEGFSWVVGFTECLEDLYRFFAAGMGIPEHVASETASVHYEQRASSSHSEGDNRRRTSVKVTPHGRFLTADPAERRLATTTGLKQGAKLATTMNGLDNDLWSWAHEMANGANHNPRTTFVGCRDPPAPQPSD